MFEFKQKVVLITGAAGNLGRAAAAAFRAAGARTALVDRKHDRLERTFGELAGSPDHLFVGDVDMTDVASVTRMAQATVDRFGRLDVLVNTVGGFRGGSPVHEEELETWETMLRLNLRTTLLSCRAVVPHMLRGGGGRIINTAAQAAFSASPGYAAYAASKSGVLRLTESLSRELARSDITVNCVVPGTLDTPENREAMPDADHDTWVEPAAVADVVVFLASHAARSVTGAAVPVHGKGASSN